MINFNTEYFDNNTYFYLKNGDDRITLYYSISDTITESRKKETKKEFTKKSGLGLKKMISKLMGSKTKKTKKDIDNELKSLKNNGEIEELVDSDGTMNTSDIPIINHSLAPRKTTDQTIPMSRVSNDPVTRGYRVYWGESKDEKGNTIFEIDYSDAFGYDETEDKDFKGTVKTLKKMGVENPVKRAKQFGKLPKAKKKNGMLKQRLSEKNSIEEEQKMLMKKMVEDILTKKYKDDGEVMEKKDNKSMSTFLVKNLKSLKKLADKEGIDINQLIKKLKSDE